MDKTLLRGKLQTQKNNFALVQAGVALMTAEDALKRIHDTFEVVKDHPEFSSFSYITYVFERDELLKQATKELRNAVLRNMLKETFELMKLYGDATGQQALVKAAPWYQFLRIVRNCLSHDFQLSFLVDDNYLGRLTTTMLAG